MNEFLRNFIMQTILKMIENVPEWQVRKYALSWYEKQILTEDDLVIIEQKYAVNEEIENTEENIEIPSEEE